MQVIKNKNVSEGALAQGFLEVAKNEDEKCKIGPKLPVIVFK